MCGVAVFLSACVKVALEGLDRHDKTVRRELVRVKKKRLAIERMPAKEDTDVAPR